MGHIFRDIRCYADSVEADGTAVQRIAVKVVQHQRVAHKRCVPVVDNVTVIQSDVVDIEGASFRSVGGRGDDELDEGRGIICPGAVLPRPIDAAGHISLGYGVQIAVDISPSGLGDVF